MKSDLQQRYCSTHKDQLCVAIDMNLQNDSQERHLCVECLKNPIKSRNSLSYEQTHNFLYQKKKIFKFEQEAQNLQNLGILKGLSQMALDLKTQYIKIFDQLQDNLVEQINIIESVQAKLDEYLEQLNLDQYLSLHQKSFAEKFQFKVFQKTVKNTLDQLFEKEKCQSFLEKLKTIDSISIKSMAEQQQDQKQNQKRSKLSFLCDEHDEEIRMYDQNESTPEEQRLICDECALDRDGPFTSLTIIFKKWEDFKNHHIQIIEQEQQNLYQHGRHFKEKIQALNDVFSQKISEICHKTTVYMESSFQDFQIEKQSFNKEWRCLSKDELLQVAEKIITLDKKQIESKEASESKNSKSKEEIIKKIQESILCLQDIMTQFVLEIQINLKLEDQMMNSNKKLVKLSIESNVFILEYMGMETEKQKVIGIISVDYYFPRQEQTNNDCQTENSKFFQSQFETLSFNQEKKLIQLSHATTQFQLKLGACKFQASLGYQKKKIKRNLHIKKCVFEFHYPYLVNYQIIEQNSIQQEDHCYVLGIYNEQKIVLAGARNRIKIFNFRNGKLKEVEILNDHTADVVSFYFMKKSISFLSAGWDETVRIWKENTFLHWTCEHVLQHKGWIAQVIMNRAEDLIISCGDPKNITFWTKNKNKWECSQTLVVHSHVVWGICLNESQNKLVSCGEDSQIIISEQGRDKTWAVLQTIACDCGYRVCFITDDLFTFQPNYGMKMIIYQFNNQNQQFDKTNEARIEQDGVCPQAFFPMSYNKSRSILINKYGKKLNFLRRKNNNDFIVEQSIKFGNYNVYGDMTQDGKYLITWDYASKSFQVWYQK